VDCESIKKQLVEQVSITNQMVSYSKAYFIDNYQSDSENLIQSLLNNVEATKPAGKIIIHQSVDSIAMATQMAKYISWRLAGSEAIWGLIANGCFIPGSSNHLNNSRYVEWTTVVPGSGGTSSGWRLEQFELPVPRRVLMRPSGVDESEKPLSDPDLFMHELNIDGLGKDIIDSLKEAVLCFKNELFLGCLALLGRASEGAWIELGISLAKAIPEDARIDGEKLQKKMEDQYLGIGKKINEVLKAYECRDIFSAIHKTCGYRPADLKANVVWADAVRESRNSIHYGATPAMSNSYEKVAALLIGTMPNLRVIYSIIEACRKSKE